MNEAPLLLLVADDHATEIESEFRSRYDRDYRIEVTRSRDEALAVLTRAVQEGTAVAMIAADVMVGSTPSWELLRETQAIVPAARRVALVMPGPTYAHHLEDLRLATLRRDLDTFVGIPLGARDEEFHTAITELLSEWGVVGGPPRGEHRGHRGGSARA